MSGDSDNEVADDCLLAFIAFQKGLSLPLLACVLLEDEQETQQERRNRLRRNRYHRMSIDERVCRVRKIPRPATLEPCDSAWNKLYHSRNLSGFITATGVDPETFDVLLAEFEPIFLAHSPYSRPIDNGRIRQVRPNQPTQTRPGRPRKTSAHACLGLVLYWTRTTCYYWTLAQMFGLTTSCCEVWLRFGKRVLLHVLSKRNDAQIKMPDAEKCMQYKAKITAKYSHLNDVGLVGDGVKIYIQKASDIIKQNAYYNGWKGDHYITNLFVFGPDGCIVAAMLNCPGSMHDSELASFGSPSIYQKLDTAYEQHGIKCVMDSAFCARNRRSIIKSIPREQCYVQCETARQAIIQDQALSVRQAAEWGMRALQSSMPRLKARWLYEERDERLVGLTLIALLYNFKCNTMDLNQIRTVFWTCTNQEQHA